jgi:uncharacterized protein (DUF885 family)
MMSSDINHPADDEVRRLADSYVDDLARRHPDTATELGDHRFDGLLPDRSEAALAGLTG